jgi:putative transposase
VPPDRRHAAQSTAETNCFVESFNGTLRDECLNLHWFLSLRDAREKVESWREDYNQVRPHSALGNLTPKQYVDGHAVSGSELATITSQVRL